MDYTDKAKEFLNVVAKNYDILKKTWAKHQAKKQREFDEDVFQDTILSIYDLIQRNGIQDDTEQGYLNYFFKSFNINIVREKQYARESKRDKTLDVFDYLKPIIDDSDTEEIKKQEAYKQFLSYHTLKIAQEHFDAETFGCFRIYYLNKGMTYEKLKNLTKVKDCKKKVLTVREWLKENISKEELNKEFNEWYNNENKNFW